MGLNNQIDENWRPDVLDLAALHEAWGASRKERKADLHRYCWLEFGKASTKELTYQEYQKAMKEKATRYIGLAIVITI